MKSIVKVKDKIIGDGNITIQTMLSNKTIDADENLAEIERLKNAGCDIVRIALSNESEVASFKKTCEKSPLPIVSDIQFDYKMAIASIEAGAAKVRINPSNIGDPQKVKLITDAAKAAGIPIRVGVNMGSLEKDAEKTYGRTAEGLAHSALNSAKMLESFGFNNIVLSVKSSFVPTMVKACRIIDSLSDYPQHIGVTEAGTLVTGTVKNSIGIGSLLLDGIGDTIRVSLSAPPIEEVYAAKRILRALDLVGGIKVVSCPTCNRCDYDLFSLAKEIEDMTFNLKGNLTIAVMGCVVNGIGEGKDADLALVGGKSGFAVYKKGVLFSTLDKFTYKTQFIELIKKEINGEK